MSTKVYWTRPIQACILRNAGRRSEGDFLANQQSEDA